MFEVDLCVFELKGLLLDFFLVSPLAFVHVGIRTSLRNLEYFGCVYVRAKRIQLDTQEDFFCVIFNDRTSALPINRCI